MVSKFLSAGSISRQKYWDSFSSMSCTESVSLQLFSVVWVFLRSLGVTTSEISMQVTKITSRICVSWTHSLPFSFWPLFSSIKWPYHQKDLKGHKFEPHNSLKFSFTNIQGLCLNFVECESFLESNSPDTLALCETNLDDSIDSGNFVVRGYLPLIRKDSVVHLIMRPDYVKEGLPLARDLSLENSADFYWSFRMAFLHSVS